MREKFLKKIGIEKEDFNLISEAVKKAEATTDGEIALAITEQSDDYSIYEIMVGMGIAIISFLISLFFIDEISNFLSRLFWYPAKWYLPAFIGLVIFVVTGVFFLLSNISFIDRMIIPKMVMYTKVREKMLIHFVERGVYHTKHHSGILIFISVLERKVFVFGDTGINEKIRADEWKMICDKIIEGIKNKQAGKALCQAVESCGKLLAKNFPAYKENPNELADGLVII